MKHDDDTHSKLTTNLRSALVERAASQPYRVLIRLSDGADPQVVAAFLGREPRVGQRTISASVSAREIRVLCDESWVQAIALSERMRPLDVESEAS